MILNIEKVVMLASALVMSTVASCFAMQFSQPVKIGASRCNHNMGGSHFIEGSTKIDASQYYNPYKKGYTGYDKGYATFDGGKLYIHYDGANVMEVKIGDSDKSNTIQNTCGSIHKINTERGITLYFLPGEEEGMGFTLIGRREDGRFVNYIDGVAIYRSFFNRLMPYWVTFEVNNDNIIVHYTGTDLNLKLKWNEAAKWFSYTRL